MIEEVLKNMGLNDKEIKVYLTLMSLGSAPASAIGKRADIERSHSIYLCKSLVKKGFVSYIEKNKTFLFTPKPPKELFKLFNKQKKEIEEKETQLHRVVGELENMINPHASLPKIQFFEGVDGLIDVYKDILKEGADIYDCNVIDKTHVHPEIIDYWRDEYMPTREKMTNRSFTLYNRETGYEEYTKFDKKVRRITLFLPASRFPFKSQVMLYGKKVAFLSLASSDLTGALIENDAIWETQMSLFRLAWDAARRLPQNKEYKDVEI
jgi:HTH-type transcriptional regulator, sugar sensing transcriptional regulator